jgi:hypothetical protein
MNFKLLYFFKKIVHFNMVKNKQAQPNKSQQAAQIAHVASPCLFFHPCTYRLPDPLTRLGPAPLFFG